MAETGNINPLSRTWPGRPVTPSRQSDEHAQKQKPPLKKNENNKKNQDQDEGSSRTIDEYA